MKKLAVCGKGGSGKSTIVCLLAQAISNRGHHVLVVDSDESNSGLYRLLGFDRPPYPLMESIGGKKGLKQKLGAKLPPGESDAPTTLLGQAEIHVSDIPGEHVLKRDSIALVSIGKILQPLEGCACPMGVLSREFLNKLDLKDNEVAIVDMEAGVEHFGRGVQTSVDSILITVEPSFESIELAERMNKLATGIGVGNIWAILNKTTSAKLASRLEAELSRSNIRVAGSIPYDAQIFQACLEGRAIRSSKATKELGNLLDILLKDERLT